MYLITTDSYIKRVANKIYTSKEGVEFVYCHDNTTLSLEEAKDINIPFVVEDITKDEAYQINHVARKLLPKDPAMVSVAVLRKTLATTESAEKFLEVVEEISKPKESYTEHGFIAWFKNLFKRA